MCGHCDKLLCDKALKEHRRLYFDEDKGVWIRFGDGEDRESRGSSPLCVSLPSSSSSEEQLAGLADVEMSSDDDPLTYVTEHQSSKRIVNLVIDCYVYHEPV